MTRADQDRVAVVTGAGSGIGRAVARALLDDGWRVALAGRREATLSETLNAAGPDAPRGLTVVTDVTDETSVRELFERTSAAFGRIDLLFNNAGVFGAPAPLGDVSLEQWKTVVETNLTGAFLCAREAFRAMRRQDPRGGRIINNGSISAHTPRPHAAPYTASKHAITGLTKSSALDGRPFNIACGQIDIGNAATDMTSRMSKGVLQADGSTATEPTMDVALVADAVVSMAKLPLSANVLSMTIMATKMPFVGRG